MEYAEAVVTASSSEAFQSWWSATVLARAVVPGVLTNWDGSGVTRGGLRNCNRNSAAIR